MRRLRVMALSIAAVVAVGAAPVSGAPRMKVLGTDPALDGPPAADVLSLSVGRDGADLLVRINIGTALPAIGSYPGAGIEWTFDVRNRTFVVEGHPDLDGFRYTLFEVVGETFRQVESLDGSFDPATGDLDMLVPLRAIGAGRGTVISGTGPRGTEDVDIHQHAGPVSPLLDSMATAEDYKVR